MKNNRSCFVNDKEIENKKKSRAQGREAGLRLNHNFPFRTSEKYKSHFSMSLCIKCTNVMPSYALIIRGIYDDTMMILRSIALCKAEKHL